MSGRVIQDGNSFDVVSASHYAGIAQLAEHLICNQGVEGSSPSASTKKEARSRDWAGRKVSQVGK